MRKLDLAGPKGNAFVIMGIARDWAEQLNKDPDAIIKEMQSGDYNHLIRVFTEEFCGLLEFTASHKLDHLDEDLYTIEENPYEW